MKTYHLTLVACLGMAAATATVASASHFRGAALVPRVSDTGLLTVTATAFWRTTFVGSIPTPTVAGQGSMTQLGATIFDNSDPRFTVTTQTFTRQLPSGAGTYNISASDCCRVATGGRGNWTEGFFTMDSTIVWNGSTANNPIAFNFASVQPQVSRLGSYSDNLDATSPQGHTLTYNQALNTDINSQPTPSFLINTGTGLMTIPGVDTPLITDHANPLNVGADAAFSGNILSSDGSSVEFDWMFDGVDEAVNQAPDVGDGSDVGVAGTLFNFLFPITDDQDILGAGLSFDAGFFGILGPVPAIAPLFNNLTGAFSWDSTGSALGSYIFQVRGRDSGNLTDVGSFTVDLIQVSGPGVVPEPGSLIVHGILALGGMSGAIVMHRRAKPRG